MNYSREQAIDLILQHRPDCPREVVESLVLLDVNFFGFDNQIHDGQIVVHKDLMQDTLDLFQFMLEKKFPLQEVSPIVKYNWDDEVSMSANNSSAFNYRTIINTDRISLHGLGRAIDINPKINPVITGLKPEQIQITQPANGTYDPSAPGTLFTGHEVVEFMKARGWEWGGDWHDQKGYKDYQHFQKPS